MAFANTRLSITVDDGGALDGLANIRAGARKGILERAMRKTVRPLVPRLKTLMPRETGLLRRSIGSKVKGYKQKAAVVGLVGARTKQGVVLKRKSSWSGARKQIPSKYAHLVDRGARPHTIRIRGKRVDHPGVQGTQAISSINGESARLNTELSHMIHREYEVAWNKALAKGKTLRASQNAAARKAAAIAARGG